MTRTLAASAILAIHYQNENCHPQGRIKIGIAKGAEAIREERLGNARRLFAAAREIAMPIIHVRLAVPPDYRGVVANTPLIRQWIELGAWKEGTWGTEFVQGLAPAEGEFVVTHTRNSALHGCPTLDILKSLGTIRLICCGVSTGYAVEGTVRHATDIGFEVTVAADACSIARTTQHEASLAAMEAIADIMTVDELVRDFASA